MKISDFLSPDQVIVNVRRLNKRQLLQDLAEKAAAALHLQADDVASALLKREELGSTGTGGGIAIPHARMQDVQKPFGMLTKLKHPIDFDAIDGQQVDIVFVLLLPISAVGDQLGALALVARRLRSTETLAQLRRAKDASELYSEIVR